MQIMFIKVDHMNGALTRTEHFRIRNNLSTRQGFFEALSMARYNTEWEHLHDMIGAGSRDLIIAESEKYKPNAGQTAWTYIDESQQRTLIITAC